MIRPQRLVLVLIVEGLALTGCAGGREYWELASVATATTCIEPREVAPPGEGVAQPWAPDLVFGVPVEGRSAPASSGADAPRPAPLAAVREVAATLRGAPLLDGERPLQFAQIQNDCERRAHVVAAYLMESNPTWIVGKAFIAGSLETASGLIEWGYHVAPYVVVQGPSGGAPTILVLDPAVSDEPLAPEQWAMAAAHGDGRVRRFTLTPATALYETSTGSSADFCEEVVRARADLMSRYERGGRGERERTRLRVRRVEDGRVWFEGTRWFVYRRELRAIFEEAERTGRTVTVRYERVDRAGWFTGNFLNIYEAVLDPAR